jgi:hypothetical protein
MAVVLGEIESPDPAKYRYILAVVKQGEAKPEVFVISEKNPRRQAVDGSHRLRMVSLALSEDFGCSDAWKDIEAFSAKGLTLVASLLGLGDEQAVRLM